VRQTFAPSQTPQVLFGFFELMWALIDGRATVADYHFDGTFQLTTPSRYRYLRYRHPAYNHEPPLANEDTSGQRLTTKVSPSPMTNLNHNATVHCCADCGSAAGGDVSLKSCKSCMLVKYCNANCQKNHWPEHKNECKQRAAELLVDWVMSIIKGEI